MKKFKVTMLITASSETAESLTEILNAAAESNGLVEILEAVEVETVES